VSSERALPVTIRDCSLSASALADQRDRATALRPAVRRVVRSGGQVHVRFDAGVDGTVLADLIATERRCCSFLDIDFDEGESVLHISSDDLGHDPALAAFAGFFEEPS
jgi:hypothetical protein